MFRQNPEEKRVYRITQSYVLCILHGRIEKFTYQVTIICVVVQFVGSGGR